MKAYLIAMATGVLVGAIYGMLNVRSPAPPVVALIGLMGMLVGEQGVPLTKRLQAGATIVASWEQEHCSRHIFGLLPGHGEGARSAHISGSHADEKCPT